MEAYTHKTSMRCVLMNAKHNSLSYFDREVLKSKSPVQYNTVKTPLFIGYLIVYGERYDG